MTRLRAKKFPPAEQQVAHFEAGAADARFHGAQGGMGHLGDLVIAQALDIGQHEGQALILRQPVQGALDLPAQLVTEGMVFRVAATIGAGEIDRLLIIAHELVERLGRPALPPAQVIVAGVGRDAQHPGLEGAAAEAGEGLVGGEESILRGIRGGIGAAEHAVAEVIDPLLVGPNQVVKGAKLAGLRGLNLLLLVHARPGARGGGRLLDGDWLFRYTVAAPKWRNGRRARLKSVWVTPMWVRVPPSAPFYGLGVAGAAAGSGRGVPFSRPFCVWLPLRFAPGAGVPASL